jgi:hypothetical protein
MSQALSHHQIAVVAYERYAAHGYHDGHDRDDWLWAEATLVAQAALAAPQTIQDPTTPVAHPHDTKLPHYERQHDAGPHPHEQLHEVHTHHRR